MARQLSIVLALLFTHLFQPSTANTSGMSPVQMADVATPNRVGTVTEVPFTINTSEVEGGASISSGILDLDWFRLNGQEAGTYLFKGRLTRQRPVIAVYLHDVEGSIIAEDLLVLGVKTTLTFSARNSALSAINKAASIHGASQTESVEIYKRADDHPLFKDLENIYRGVRGWPTEEADRSKKGELGFKIAYDLATNYKAP